MSLQVAVVVVCAFVAPCPPPRWSSLIPHRHQTRLHGCRDSYNAIRASSSRLLLSCVCLSLLVPPWVAALYQRKDGTIAASCKRKESNARCVRETEVEISMMDIKYCQNHKTKTKDIHKRGNPVVVKNNFQFCIHSSTVHHVYPTWSSQSRPKAD